MTPAELRRICESLNDERGTGGQTRLAELLEWDGSTIRRKLSGALPISTSDALAIRAAATGYEKVVTVGYRRKGSE